MMVDRHKTVRRKQPAITEHWSGRLLVNDDWLDGVVERSPVHVGLVVCFAFSGGGAGAWAAVAAADQGRALDRVSGIDRPREPDELSVRPSCLLYTSPSPRDS